MDFFWLKNIDTDPAMMGWLALGGAVFLLAGLILLYIYRQKVTLHDLLDTVLLEVTLPKEVSEKEEDAKKQEKELIAVGEQFYANLGALIAQRQPFMSPAVHFCLEMAAYNKQIYFYVNAPRKYKDFVERTIHAQYPKAVVEEVPDYNIFTPQGTAVAAEMKLRDHHMLPIKTYLKQESDPLNMMTTALSKLNPGEGAAIQIIFRRAPRSWRNKGLKIARRTMAGKMPERFFGETAKSTGQSFGEQFGKLMGDQDQSQMSRQDDMPHLTPMEQEKVKGIEEKANKTAFRVKIRMVSSAQSSQNAKTNLDMLVNSFAQFDLPEFNGFRNLKLVNQREIINDYIFRRFGRSTKNYLNTEEMTSLFHFPIRTTETPAIKRLEAKQAPAPANTPKEGMPLGLNTYRGVSKDVHLKDEDAMRHLYIIGKTGMGKTALIVNLASYHIQKGRGVCIVDPHGDLIEDTLATMPRERADDVIVFDPSDLERPVGLNILDYDRNHPEQKDFVVGEMIRIFEKLFPPEMIGPMFEHNMRNVMLTLLEDEENPGTIVDIPRMFTDEAYQRYKLRFVKDPLVRSFWEKEMAKTSDFHKSEMLGYLISKVGRFVENSMMRNIIGQSHSSFDIREIMDQKKILLVNLSKGRTGEINSSLLGLILVSKIQMAALSRADSPEEQRSDFFLLIDEFQNFVTDSIATILSEARKYRLSLTMAHQYVAQLAEKSEAVRNAVFGNVGTILAMRVGAPDAEFLESEFTPTFDRLDLQNVDKFNAYVKMLIDNKATKPFNVKLYPPPENRNHRAAELIKQISRLKYGKERSLVEKDIGRRMKLGEPERKPNLGMGSFR